MSDIKGEATNGDFARGGRFKDVWISGDYDLIELLARTAVHLREHWPTEEFGNDLWPEMPRQIVCEDCSQPVDGEHHPDCDHAKLERDILEMIALVESNLRGKGEPQDQQ